MIRHIIFDLGGVLIDWDPRYVYRTVFESESEMKWFLDNICTMDWNVQQDAGRSLAEATTILQQKHPEWKSEIAIYYGQWVNMLKGPIHKTVSILEKIREENRFNLFALTNWSAETFPIALQRYNFLNYFQGIVVSGEEKCIKPDPRIYKILLDRYQLEASECLFIDDNKHNVAGALALGIQALHFSSPQALQEQLIELKILNQAGI